MSRSQFQGGNKSWPEKPQTVYGVLQGAIVVWGVERTRQEVGVKKSHERCRGTLQPSAISGLQVDWGVMGKDPCHTVST